MVRSTPAPALPRHELHTVRYRDFRGIDLRSEVLTRDDGRSPDMLNMYCAANAVQKRCGWRVLKNLNACIHGIYKYDEGNYLLHAGSSLYRLDSLGTGSPQVVRNASGAAISVNDNSSVALRFADRLYLLDGANYLYYDGEIAGRVADIAFVPYTSALGSDDGSMPDHNQVCLPGESLQPVNLLTRRRRNTFRVRNWTGSNGAYYGDEGFRLDAKASEIIAVKRGDTPYAVSDFRLNDTGEILYFRSGFLTAGDFEVEFLAAETEPAASSAALAGISTENAGVAGIADIESCRIMSIYSNRIFYSGNPAKPNYDWCCELNNPCYIPDISYTAVGDEAAIMGYMRLGDEQLIIKAPSEQDASVFLRSGRLSAEYGDMLFTVKQGISGTGAPGFHAFANLAGDTLFLSRDGVMAVTSQYINAERVLQQRSSYVNSRLCSEQGLESARACIWRGCYLLFINSHVYIADSRLRSYTDNTTGSFEYEWYYWDNIPAISLFVEGDALYFGTADGELCRFNTDMKNADGQYLPASFMDGYSCENAAANAVATANIPTAASMNAVPTSNASMNAAPTAAKVPCAIHAHWYSRPDDDGSFAVEKNMPPDGCAVFLKSYPASSARISFVTERFREEQTVSANAGLFDFSQVDFSRFSFNTMPYCICPLKLRLRRYKSLQLCIENNEPQEALGIYGVERRWYTHSYARD